MRLDKYLKVARLIKRRTVANDACDVGRVTVKVGDVLELAFGARTLKVQVLQTPEHVGKNEAGLLYQEIE